MPLLYPQLALILYVYIYMHTLFHTKVLDLQVTYSWTSRVSVITSPCHSVIPRPLARTEWILVFLG